MPFVFLILEGHGKEGFPQSDEQGGVMRKVCVAWYLGLVTGPAGFKELNCSSQPYA